MELINAYRKKHSKKLYSNIKPGDIVYVTEILGLSGRYIKLHNPKKIIITSVEKCTATCFNEECLTGKLMIHGRRIVRKKGEADITMHNRICNEKFTDERNVTYTEK